MNHLPVSNLSVSFSHMGFFAHDLGLMEDFYRRLLGFTVTDRGVLNMPKGPVSLVFLSRDPEEHHQIVLASGRPAELGFNVINQISFRVPDVGSLRRLHAALSSEESVQEIRAVTHGNAISVYFLDPEGNRIEVFMDTPWYCSQPLREPVDFSLSDSGILAAAEAIARASTDFMPRSEWVERMRYRMDNGIHS
jgi:catechol-2,3-dioxygenase